MSGSNQSRMAQTMFLNQGGIYSTVLAKKRDLGELAEDYVYYEYPKMLRISRGFETINCSTETIKGRTIEWTESREMFDEIVVASEEEEERVLSGGKTSAQLEQERQDLHARAVAMGIKADPNWSLVRLRRELGEEMNTPPKDELGALEARLNELQKMADMKAKIAALEAQLTAAPVREAPSDEITDLRAALAEAGVRVDARWGVARLREEFERVTTPDAG